MAKFNGGKFSSSHTTCIDAAVDAVKAAEKCQYVTKIVLGIIKSGKNKSSRQSIKIVDVPAGLRLTVRDSSCVQTIYIYTSNQHKTAEDIYAIIPSDMRKKKKNK